jgi:hypothetical protein
MVPETKERTSTITVYDNVTEEKVEKYTVQVPSTTQEEIDVTVCKMVAQTVSVPVWSNGMAVGTESASGSYGAGAYSTGASSSAGAGLGAGILSGRGLFGKHLGGLGCGSRKAAGGAACGSAAGACAPAAAPAAASDCGCN